jgi:hypothetical protein
MSFSFSYCEEEGFAGDYQTREAAIEAALADPEIDLSPLSGELIVESILDQSEDLPDGWPNCNSTVYLDLTHALERAFLDWIQRNGLKPGGVVDKLIKHTREE